MYLIDRENNKISSVQQKTFIELGFKERAIYKNGLHLSLNV